ncbi:hypothetical protein BKA69DRAFT_1127679 [Paraphysoderma sedebokerense]|nr:hypothetical protein BKA69DRAFT_1127679 [Paraphysoderma sedebokerense]
MSKSSFATRTILLGLGILFVTQLASSKQTVFDSSEFFTNHGSQKKSRPNSKDPIFVNQPPEPTIKPKSLQTQWDILGPFPIGEYGADTLNAFGGITGLKRGDSSATFATEFVNGGKTKWVRVNSKDDGSVEVKYDVNEGLLTDMFGIAGLAWRAWAIADFQVPTSGVYKMNVRSRRFFIDNQPQIGDPYGKLSTFIRLKAGAHSIRFAFGGYGATGSFVFTAPILVSDAVISTDIEDSLVPDIIDQYLSSDYLSFIVTNVVEKQLKAGDMSMVVKIKNQNQTVTTANATNVTATNSTINSTSSVPQIVSAMPNLQPLQSKAVAISLQELKSHQFSCGSTNTVTFHIDFELSPELRSEFGNVTFKAVELVLRCRKWGEGFKFTFLDFDGSVHTAGVRPPVNSCPESGCPVLFSTHGASVTAQDDVWIYSYQAKNSSWILLPTNRRPFGYDWQTVGLVNGLSSLKALARDLPGAPRNEKSKWKVDPTSLLFAGHSMGGHGCWVFSTHFPDLALGSLPAMAWTKQEHYLPQYLRSDYGHIDHFLRSITQKTLGEYDPELYSSNLAGIPTLVRMGGKDDVVPPYFNRRMARMVNEWHGNPAYTGISEVPGGGHWFDGVVDDSALEPFFNRYLTPQKTRPQLPQQFIISTMNPANFGSKGGIQILQLVVPYTVGRIKVTQRGSEWELKTRNIKRFEFVELEGMVRPRRVNLDGTAFDVVPKRMYCREKQGRWGVCDGEEWKVKERSPRTYGPARQAFETGSITIVYSTTSAAYGVAASNLARDLYYIGRFAPTLIPLTEVLSRGNIAESNETTSAIVTNLAIIAPVTELTQITSFLRSSSPSVASTPETLVNPLPSSTGFILGNRKFTSPSHSLLYLTPFNKQQLALVVSGNSEEATLRAASQIPINSVNPIPDYLVTNEKSTWMGLGGVVASGFWGNEWQFEERVGFIDELETEPVGKA